ncbi:uncharacterized protein LOC133203464 [Saccostrea echinata]|uniref:uncharacterized protein LOC133203464 n=1 Tax=Saccostrea echinata TaxID=191078 RepID=UPI002A818B43|nr:uncharacterized protein LOC133203464 [Saccostrea echinata]
MYRLVLQKSVTVTGVRCGYHITRVSSDRVWISDYNNLILTNTAGDKLHHLTGIDRGYGVHTVTRDGDLIYIDSHSNINKLSTDHRVKSTLIKYTAPWVPQCVYSSPSTGDLLVGMYRYDTDTAKVNRYNNTGEHIQTIQYDNNTGQGLYSYPYYITENRNGDVIVSDWRRVVVTDGVGRHRFSYTGPPSGSGLAPRGICTDALSHILVFDLNTHSVQILDCDGRFLSQIETRQHGIDRPWGLSYDNNSNCVWVGSVNNNTVNIYRLIHEDSLTEFLRKEKTTVFHARGILVGCTEAGKTTLLRRLRGKRQNVGEVTKSFRGITTLLKRLRGKRQNVSEVTESTRGLEVHQHLFIVKDGILEVADDDSPLKTFIRINAADLKPDPSSEVSVSATDEKHDNLERGNTDKNNEVIYCREEKKERNIELSSSQTEGKEEKKEDNMEMSSSPTEGTEEETAVETMANILSSEAQAMVKDEIFQKILSEKEKLPTVSMLDFAGQLAYYACHQIYVTPKAFFILVLDVTKRFEDVVSQEKDNQEGSIFSVWTYKDYLKFWITSIKTFGGKKAPLFLVVTHTERKSTAEIKKYFGEFWEAVPDEDRDWLRDSLNDREYAVGLDELNDNSKKMLESMKMSIVELFKDEINTKIEMPSSWALMEQLLYEGAWKVLSLSEIWKLNLSLPHEYQIKSDEEMSMFLKCFHDNGLLLYFEEEKLRENAVLDIQWFAKAFSKIIADENHINKDCKTNLIKEWKSFNKTGELKDKVIDALWKDEPSYLKHKSEIMSYMEKLQMLVALDSFEAVSEGGMSWYVPCMNKKQFKANFCEEKWECSSILCFRFTSFAMFVFYRLVAYCMSFLRWSASIDEDNEGSPCLYQTAAVFDHNEHTVVVGISNDDIQLQVLRITPLTIDKDVSNEIGESVEKAIEKLTETFIGTKIFHRGYKCQNVICNEKDLSFTLASELSNIKTDKDIQCKCRLKEKHVINVERTLSFWEKRKLSDSSTPMASGQDLGGRSRFAKLGMAMNDVLNQAYRDILEMEVLPSDIESKAKASPVYKRLRPEQEHLLLDAKHLGYKNFDISLTYTLIRNISSKIPKPTKGKWGEEPAAGEVTVGDDIERIRLIRNSLTAHVSSASIPQTEFDDTWLTMSDICRRLETFTGKNYFDTLKDIKTLTLRKEDEDAIIKNKMQEFFKTMKSNMLEIETMLNLN